MESPARREMSYSLIEPVGINVKWSGKGWLTEGMTAVASPVRVDFQQRTITLPEGKFDLDCFMRIAKDICLRLP